MSKFEENFKILLKEPSDDTVATNCWKKIESAFKVVYSQINAAESKNKATVKINDTKVEALLGTVNHYSGKGDASNAIKKIEELKKSPEYNALTPEQKELVNIDIRKSEVKLTPSMMQSLLIFNI